MKFYSDVITEDVLTLKDSLCERHLEVCLIDIVPSREACVILLALRRYWYQANVFFFVVFNIHIMHSCYRYNK